jgi:hypothetical protein
MFIIAFQTVCFAIKLFGLSLLYKASPNLNDYFCRDSNVVFGPYTKITMFINVFKAVCFAINLFKLSLPLLCQNFKPNSKLYDLAIFLTNICKRLFVSNVVSKS